MIIHNFDPILIDLGYLQIRWYSLSYILGILLGWWFGKNLILKNLNKSDKKVYTDNFDDLITYIIVGIILGGRLGYVLFYNPNFYFENTTEIFKLWKGGMSFHGGLLGVIISTLIFSKIKNLNHKIYFDTISCVAPIGIFFGRIANFVNGELYGIHTEKWWGVVFPKIDDKVRHPSQVYEAILEGALLFFLLNYVLRKKIFRHGEISFLFLILYGIFRIICEQFREPDEHIGFLFNYLSMGSSLSLIMIIFGLIFITKSYFSNEKNK